MASLPTPSYLPTRAVPYGVMIEVLREADKQQWMLRVQLGERA